MAHKVTISQVWYHVLLLYLPSLPLTPPPPPLLTLCVICVVCVTHTPVTYTLSAYLIYLCLAG